MMWATRPCPYGRRKTTHCGPCTSKHMKTTSSSHWKVMNMINIIKWDSILEKNKKTLLRFTNSKNSVKMDDSEERTNLKY